MTTLSTAQKERIERIAQEWGGMPNPRRNYRQYMIERYRKALTAFAKEEQREREWQPIEIAPKDVPIIGLKGQMAYHTKWTGFYDKWPGEEGGPTYKYAWTMTTRDEQIPWEPTHWMPLPKPPTL